jgi:hypothetical protein
MRKGNCCDDFEKECRNEIEKENCKLCEICDNGKCNKCKNNSFKFKENYKDCECNDDFKYDIENDVCISLDLKIHKEKKSGNKIKIKF